MALRTPPSWLQNGSHPAENDRLTTKAIWQTTGIVNSTDLQITQNGGGNMSVNVSSGWAAIVGTTQANMGVYMAYNDASTNLTIATASSSNPRIDLVVITINDAYYTGSLNNVSFQVIAGTPAASPTVPATPANSLALGQIAVGTSVTSILTANITNYGTQATSPFGNVTTTGTQTLTNKDLTSGTNIFPTTLGGGMTLLSTTAITSTAAITISSINQTHKDLLIVVDNAAIATAGNAIKMQVNGLSTGHGYNSVGDSTGSGSPGVAYIQLTGGLNGTNSVGIRILIQRYATTTGAKLINALSSYTNNYSAALSGTMVQGIQTATTAITSVTISPNGGNFTAQGNIYIYGVD